MKLLTCYRCKKEVTPILKQERNWEKAISLVTQKLKNVLKQQKHIHTAKANIKKIKHVLAKSKNKIKKLNVMGRTACSC